VAWPSAELLPIECVVDGRQRRKHHLLSGRAKIMVLWPSFILPIIIALATGFTLLWPLFLVPVKIMTKLQSVLVPYSGVYQSAYLKD